MTDTRAPRSPLTGVLLGALIGGVFGYLCFTDEGRRLHRRLDRWLDDTVAGMQRLQETGTKARNAMDEGRRAFQSVDN